jgi:hypothetical protein
MKQPNENLIAQFENNAQPTPPAPARDFERLATHERGIPRQGFVKEIEAATQRGREQIAADAGRRGERVFPPAREVVKP